MKTFLSIVGGSVLVFIALAMIEERETFARNWFVPAAAPQASPAERDEVARAVYDFRTLAAHWYGTGGDGRFGERLPASAAVIDEIRADTAYVRRNGRVETPRLIRLEVLDTNVTGESAAEVRTREFWVTEFHWISGGMSDEPRSDVIFVRYRLARDGAKWVITSWDPVDPPREEPPA